MTVPEVSHKVVAGHPGLEIAGRLLRPSSRSSSPEGLRWGGPRSDRTPCVWLYHAIPTLYNWLVVWNMAFICFYDFPIILGIMIPTHELIFFRGVGQPPTRYVYMVYVYYS